MKGKAPFIEAVAFDEAREKVLRGAGKSFDPAVVDAFTRAAEELRDYVGKVVLEGAEFRHIHS